MEKRSALTQARLCHQRLIRLNQLIISFIEQRLGLNITEKAAVCEKEDEKMIDISKNKIPKQAKEGDVLIIKADRIRFDLDETEERRKRIEKMTENLWE